MDPADPSSKQYWLKPDARQALPVTAQLDIESTTWNRDSHELFDYENKQVAKKKFRILKENYRVIRQGIEVSVISEANPPPSYSDFLLSVKFSQEGAFVIHAADRSYTQLHQHVQARKLWLIVKELKHNQHSLQLGDVIKLGRFKLRVKQVVKDGPVQEVKLDDTEPPKCQVDDLAPEATCRICLSGQVDTTDPFISPCKCHGTIQYLHLECCKKWINLKTTNNQQQSSNNPDGSGQGVTFYKPIQCEICNAHVPSCVDINGDRTPLVNIKCPEPPFIVLENLGNANQPKGMHIMCMKDKKELKLGRGHESDVRIADVSISRCHAVIRYVEESKSFILEDNNSKFGTLVNLKRPLEVPRTEMLSVQVGRTVLYFSLAKPSDPEPVKTELATNDQFPAEATEDSAMDDVNGGSGGGNVRQHGPQTDSFVQPSAPSGGGGGGAGGGGGPGNNSFSDGAGDDVVVALPSQSGTRHVVRPRFGFDSVHQQSNGAVMVPLHNRSANPSLSTVAVSGAMEAPIYQPHQQSPAFPMAFSGNQILSSGASPRSVFKGSSSMQPHSNNVNSTSQVVPFSGGAPSGSLYNSLAFLNNNAQQQFGGRSACHVNAAASASDSAAHPVGPSQAMGHMAQADGTTSLSSVPHQLSSAGNYGGTTASSQHSSSKRLIRMRMGRR
eukprot:Selendium_serpulae@DN6120_c2_g2_i2.p1